MSRGCPSHTSPAHSAESPALRTQVLIVDADLLAAEAMASSLAASGLTARFVLPATVEHLREVLDHWRPDETLLSAFSFTDAERNECREVLRAAGVSAAWYGGDVG
jgi:hypothetical protein